MNAIKRSGLAHRSQRSAQTCVHKQKLFECDLKWAETCWSVCRAFQTESVEKLGEELINEVQVLCWFIPAGGRRRSMIWRWWLTGHRRRRSRPPRPAVCRTLLRETRVSLRRPVTPGHGKPAQYVTVAVTLTSFIYEGFYFTVTLCITKELFLLEISSK